MIEEDCKIPASYQRVFRILMGKTMALEYMDLKLEPKYMEILESQGEKACMRFLRNEVKLIAFEFIMNHSKVVLMVEFMWHLLEMINVFRLS